MAARFSIRALLLAVGALGFSLAATQWRPVPGALAMTGLLVVVALAMRRDPRGPRLIVGALFGPLVLVFAASVVAAIRNEYLRSVPNTSMDLARQFAIPLGGFAGGLIGYLLASPTPPATRD